MLSVRLVFISALLFSLFQSSGQSNKVNRVNTSGIEAYFKVANTLKSGAVVSVKEWKELFHSPIYQMMIAGGAIDTSLLKAEMQQVYASSITPDETTSTATLLYHKAYKDNQEQLEKYISLLHKTNMADSVKLILYPFLPKRLQSDGLFPQLYYLFYGAPEATGYGGVVINDALHSYRIDSYKFGLLTAHEAFHSIVSIAFQQALKKDIDYQAADFNLFYFLQNISEEGVADLIDKPLLLKPKSPVYKEVKELTKNDDVLSVVLIKQLDSLLRLAYTSERALEKFENFGAFASLFGKNGGHIPGRFMGMVISKAGLLQKHLAEVENPISFIITYNAAAKKYRKKYPVFTVESIKYLQKLKAKSWKE